MKNKMLFAIALSAVVFGTTACPLQTKVVQRPNDDESMNAEMSWSSGRETPATRNFRKVKKYGEGSYGVEEPITLPETIPEEIDVELPPVQNTNEVVQTRARLEIKVGSENPEEKSIEAYYLRETSESGKKQKLRVRLKNMKTSIQGKPYFRGTLHLSLDRYDGRRIEFSFNLRSKPKSLDYDWQIIRDSLHQKVEETSEGKPIYPIARLRVKNTSDAAIKSEFTSLPDYQAGYRVEAVTFEDRMCPKSPGTKSDYFFASVVDRVVVVDEESSSHEDVIQIIEHGKDPMNRALLSPGESKSYIVYAIDRKSDPSVQMRSEKFLTVCEGVCIHQTCEPTPGRGGERDQCYCDERGWKKTPGDLWVGTRIVGRAIFSDKTKTSYSIRYGYSEDEGADQLSEMNLIGRAIFFNPDI